MLNRHPRIAVAISAHGYGHLTQTIAVLKSLHAQDNAMSFKIFCNLDRTIIAHRLGFDDFEHEKCAVDVGLVQMNPLTVDLSASLKAYRDFHCQFTNKVSELATSFNQWKADLVLSNISYLALAAADQANIPGVALASLSWDHVIKTYFDVTDKEVSDWFQSINDAYRTATLALLPEPALPPLAFSTTRSISPLLIPGKKTAQIKRLLNIAADDIRPIIMCSLGGIENGMIPTRSLETSTEFHWLIKTTEKLAHLEHIHDFHDIELIPFHEIIASVDGVLGKPGYGTAVEVVAHDLPFVFTRRGDFPDEPYIIAWLKQHARTLEVDRATWSSGQFSEPFKTLFKSEKKGKPQFNGAEQAANHILQLIE